MRLMTNDEDWDRALKFPNMLRTESGRTTAALRHRVGRNTFRFLCETHLELPAQPPPGCRTLVLFAHFDLQGIVDPYVAYYPTFIKLVRTGAPDFGERLGEVVG